MKNRFYWLAAGAVIALGIMVFSGLRLASGSAPRYHGSRIETPRTAPDFTLPAAGNQPFTLSAQKGKVVLLFFGYTTCPDVCPATMAKFSRLREHLGKNAADLRLALITVDPQRDSPEAMSAYLSSFDSTIQGLTGTPEQLQAVWKDYGVAVEYSPGATPDGYYVSHTDRIYAIDRGGNLRLIYPSDTPLAELEDDVKALLKEKSG